MPTELDLIDAQRGGDPSPDIAAYLAGPRPVVDIYPSANVDVQELEFNEVRAEDNPGRIQYRAHSELAFHVQSTGQDTNTMRDLAERYMAAGIRVLFFRKNGLQTVADPTRFASYVEPRGNAKFLDEEQNSGALVRSARLPFSVWMIESLT